VSPEPKGKPEEEAPDGIGDFLDLGDSPISKELERFAGRILGKFLGIVENNARTMAAREEQRLQMMKMEAAKIANAPPPQSVTQLEMAYRHLGVTENDPIALVKNVYRAKAKYLHPDKNTGDKEAFQLLEAAYKIVMDDLKKRGKK
jgi:DnaJ-class molecular chaperone